MTPDTAQDVVPERISDLLSERATLREWIERVEERRDDVRPAVYQRVRGDYLERLEGVESALATHRSDLEESLATHRSAVEELQEEREDRAARLEEAELRHAVGELDEEEWGERESALRGELDGYEERLEEERSAAVRLEEVLEELESVGERGPAPEASTTKEAGAPASEPEPPASGQEPSPPEAKEAEAPVSAEEAPGSDREAPEPEGGPEAEEDELDFLESLAWDEEGLDTLSLMLDEDEEEGEGDDSRDGGAG